MIIPAFNEEDNILPVVGRIQRDFPNYDYVIINDGSTDRTAAICRENGFHMVDLPVNLGLAGAFQTGMKYALQQGYAYAIQFDADGQHRPEYIAALLEKINEGYDVVIGSRFLNKARPWSMRMLGSRMISLAIRLTTGRTIHDPTSGMRLYSRKVFRDFALNVNFSPEPDTISYLLRNKHRIAEVQVDMDERTAGDSFFSFSVAVSYMLRILLSILVIQPIRTKKDRGAL